MPTHLLNITGYHVSEGDKNSGLLTTHRRSSMADTSTRQNPPRNWSPVWRFGVDGNDMAVNPHDKLERFSPQSEF